MKQTSSPSLPLAGMFALLAVASLTIMVGCVIVPGLPAISSRLEFGWPSGLLVTLPSLGVVLFGPLAASLLEKLGLRRGLLLGLFLYGLLGVLGAVLRGTWPLVMDRVLLGGATAIVMAAGTGLISCFYQGSARLGMMAKQGMAIELGGMVFLFVGGLLAVRMWDLPFLLYFFAWLLLLVVWRTVPSIRAPSQPAAKGDSKASISAVLKVVYAVALLSMVAFFTAIIVLPSKLAALGFNEATTGYFLAFVSLMAVLGAASMPLVGRRLGGLGTLSLAMVLYAAAHACFAVAPGTAVLVVGAILLGAGFGLSIPMVNHMTVEQSGEADRGRKLAYLSMAVFSGQFLASFVEMVPGEAWTTFATASGLSLVACGLLAAVRTKQVANQP